MRTSDFDFELPEERVALRPAEPRDLARLLVVRPGQRSRASGPGRAEGHLPVFNDCIVRDLPDLLCPGDALVVNDTRVIPAALAGVRHRGTNSTNVAFNLLARVDGARWRAFARPAKRLTAGDRVQFGDLGAMITLKADAGEIELAFDVSGAELDAAIARVGAMPLPPYIALKRGVEPGDAETYQTMYAAHDGAVAAPTAGLHFTPALMAALEARGISVHRVTLHVGAGTFLPVKAETTDEHKMHAEWCTISTATASALNEVRKRGGRIVSVGTTSLRTLESAATPDGVIEPFTGATSIFITPGYRFRAVDVLLTNFHLPRSTLFMLVAAFSGLETMREAYAHAIRQHYRFYSYGDACLLFPAR